MAEAQAAQSRELISFRVAEQEYCVEITAVREIRGWAPATPLPHAPDYVRGVINLRGAILPIVDMSARLGMAMAEPTSRHVIMVVWIEGQLVGLLVDAVCDIITVDEVSLQDTPEDASATVQTFVRALLTIEDRMIGLIDLGAVLPALAAAA